MGQGMGSGFGSAFAAGAGAAALRQVLEDKYNRAVHNQQLKLERDQFDEQRRQRQVAEQLQAENSKFLNDQRAAQAERDRPVAERDANRQKALQDLITNPQALAALPPLQRLLTLNQYGVANVGIHDVEDPAQHAAHLSADDQRKRDDAFTDWQKRYDYENAHPRPARLKIATPFKDDPSLPLGTQWYIAGIVTKHNGNFAAAPSELSEYLNSRQTQADHPTLNPIKALSALKQAMGAPAGAPRASLFGVPGNPVLMPQGVGTPTAAPESAGTAKLYQHPDGTIRVYPPSSGSTAAPVKLGATAGRGGVPAPQTSRSAIPPAARQKAADVLRAEERNLLREYQAVPSRAIQSVNTGCSVFLIASPIASNISQYLLVR